MKPDLRLDFSKPARSPGLAAWGLFVAGLAAAFAAGAAYVEAGRWRDAMEDAVTEMKRLSQRRGAPLAVPAAVTEETRREIQRANHVIERIAVPWNALFRGLEGAADETVALLSVQPDAEKRAFRLEGEAKDLAAALAFVARLEAADTLSDAMLASHAVKGAGGRRPVEFTVTGRWTAHH